MFHSGTVMMSVRQPYALLLLVACARLGDARLAAAAPRSHAALARQAARAAALMTMMKPAKASSDDDIAMVAAHRRALHTPGTTAQHLRAGLCRRAGVQSCWPPAEETGARAGCQNVKAEVKKRTWAQAKPPSRVCFASGPTGANSEQGSAPAAMSGYATMRASAVKEGEKKSEEEEFSTGPLSVLKQSVTSNTQVGKARRTLARTHTLPPRVKEGEGV